MGPHPIRPRTRATRPKHRKRHLRCCLLLAPACRSEMERLGWTGLPKSGRSPSPWWLDGKRVRRALMWTRSKRRCARRTCRRLSVPPEISRWARGPTERRTSCAACLAPSYQGQAVVSPQAETEAVRKMERRGRAQRKKRWTRRRHGDKSKRKLRPSRLSSCEQTLAMLRKREVRETQAGRVQVLRCSSSRGDGDMHLGTER